MSDIFKSKCSLLVCPTNGVGVMGAGLAKQFKKVYPSLEAHYLRAVAQGFQQPGTFSVYHALPPSGKHIVLLPTKRHWKDGATYSDLEATLSELGPWFNDQIPKRIRMAMPKIGCGLGQLSWDIVETMIRHHLDMSRIELC